MKHFIVLMLGVAAFFGFAVAAELGALPSWAGGALLAFGVLLLLYAWRSWGSTVKASAPGGSSRR